MKAYRTPEEQRLADKRNFQKALEYAERNYANCTYTQVLKKIIENFYSLTKAQFGPHINTFYITEFYNNYQFSFKDIVVIKECDKVTANHLYNRKYNKVYIRIWQETYVPKITYRLKVRIDSIDDSSYGIWFKGVTEVYVLVEIIKRYIASKKAINGEDLLTFCEDYGGVDKDYN